MPTALITGYTGQDGTHLRDALIDRGYRVHGLVRRNSRNISNTALSLNDASREVRYIEPVIHYGDMADANSIERIVDLVQPDEIYNLAAMSQVKISYDIPAYTFDVIATGTIRLLEAVRKHCPKAKFYQASSSEMFGSSPPPQNEQTAFRPCSPYAVAKLAAHHAAINYRESYGMFVCCGILFNHEGPWRSQEFVTRKISMAVANIYMGWQEDLVLGNLDASRDWGLSEDYVEAMILMLQQPQPDDYVIATGESHTVREFAEAAFNVVKLDYRNYVKTTPALYRPKEVTDLRGDAVKAMAKLGWFPATTFRELVRIMVEHDLSIVGCDMEKVRNSGVV